MSKSFIAILLTFDYIDRPVQIYNGFLDASNTLISDPILMLDGRIDHPVISEDPAQGSATISISVANQFVDWERSQYRTTNQESQDFYFPGDKGMEFASEVTEEIFWGRLPS